MDSWEIPISSGINDFTIEIVAPNVIRFLRDIRTEEKMPVLSHVFHQSGSCKNLLHFGSFIHRIQVFWEPLFTHPNHMATANFCQQIQSHFLQTVKSVARTEFLNLNCNFHALPIQQNRQSNQRLNRRCHLVIIQKWETPYVAIRNFNSSTTCPDCEHCTCFRKWVYFYQLQWKGHPHCSADVSEKITMLFSSSWLVFFHIDQVPHAGWGNYQFAYNFRFLFRIIPLEDFKIVPRYIWTFYLRFTHRIVALPAA